MADDPLKLSLNAGGANGAVKSHPVAGYFAVGFGLLGIFSVGYIFVPLALICSLIALFMGQFIWAVVGLLLTLAGLLTSPVLLGILGLTYLASHMGF